MNSPQPPLTLEEQFNLRAAIAQLDSEFPTEEAIENEVFRIATFGKACALCHCTKFSIVKDSQDRIASCEGCGNVFYYTSGTFFDHAKKLRANLFTLHLADRGIVYNANKIHEMLGISYSTAHNICLKVGCLSLQEMLTVAPQSVEAMSVQLNDVIDKRSRETDARQHPQTEKEKELQQFAATACGIGKVRSHIHQILKTTDADDLYENEQDVYDALSTGPETVEDIATETCLNTTDLASALMTLMICRLVTRLPGERFERSSNTNSRFFASPIANPRLHQEVAKAKWFIKKVFDGVSRRYLQLYLATAWSTFGRSNLGDNSIVNQAAKNNEFLQELKTYVSPIVVKICPI